MQLRAPLPRVPPPSATRALLVPSAPQARPNTADQLFDELDEDGNGVLDLSELKTGLRKLRQAATGTLAGGGSR